MRDESTENPEFSGGKDLITDGIMIGVYEPDPEPKRALFASLKVDGTVHRRCANVDVHGVPIDIKTNLQYKPHRGASIPRKLVTLIGVWDKNEKHPSQEHADLFHHFQVSGKAVQWGWGTFSHLFRQPSLRKSLIEIQELQSTLNCGHLAINELHGSSGVVEAENLVTTFEVSVKRMRQSFDAIDRTNPKLLTFELDQHFKSFGKDWETMQPAFAEQLGIADMKAAEEGVGPQQFSEEKSGKGKKRKAGGQGGIQSSV
jgi:hypothetical protein